jgi:O-succinylbenzoic acid--CoA ligase
MLARPAIYFEGQVLTHAALEARVAEALASLQDGGVRPGDVVALQAPNSPDWVINAHAVMRLGAVLLPLSTRLTEAERSRDLATTRARWLLTPTALTSLSGGVKVNGPAVLVLTSGTTGRPKAVALTRQALEASARAVNTALALTADDVWYCAMPLFHVGGLGILFRCALAGAAIQLHQRFDPDAVSGTVASFVPTMLRSFLDRHPWPPELRVAMLGGAPVPPDLVERCPAALATYGLSEAASTVTLVRPGADAATRLTCGTPLPGTGVRIVDDDDQPARPGEIGRIQVAGPTLMTGYLDAPPIGEWLDTGDFGSLDGQGRLTVAARREDLIISGGENVYPAEIEAVLATHPAVSTVAVVGAAHPRWGQVPVAFVSGRPTDLAPWLADRLARFKQPQAYRWLPELPQLANGKIDRRALRQLLAGVEGLNEETVHG